MLLPKIMDIEEILMKINIYLFYKRWWIDRKIWEKVSTSIKKGFDSEPVYNGKYLRAKLKSYEGKINTNFRNGKIPKEGSQCISLLVILNDSVYITDKNYYPQVLLE